MTRADRFAYCAGALVVAAIGVELAHRYYFRVMDAGWRLGESVAAQISDAFAEQGAA